MVVDDESEVSFSIPQGTLPWQPNFVDLVDGCRWKQTVSGAAGRANVGPASSYRGHATAFTDHYKKR